MQWMNPGACMHQPSDTVKEVGNAEDSAPSHGGKTAAFVGNRVRNRERFDGVSQK